MDRILTDEARRSERHEIPLVTRDSVSHKFHDTEYRFLHRLFMQVVISAHLFDARKVRWHP